MKIRFLLLVCFVVLQEQIWANEGGKVVVSGKVSDKLTNETLAGVKIYVEGTTIYTYTDLNGNYTLFVPSSSATKLIYSSVSYSENKLDLSSALLQKQILLNPAE